MVEMLLIVYDEKDILNLRLIDWLIDLVLKRRRNY